MGRGRTFTDSIQLLEVLLMVPSSRELLEKQAEDGISLDLPAPVYS